VRYSYEQVEIGDRSQWVLVPYPAEELKGNVTTESITTAFELLRDEKDTSYGDTSIEVDGSTIEGARVKVHIDPDHSKYKLIIMAETVYTLTELGVTEIRFPGYAEGTVGRADIPFTAFTPTLPLWRALPLQKTIDARVRLPDGTTLERSELERRWNQGDAELREALFSYLKDDQVYTVVSVTERLPELDLSYTEKVLPLLEHESLSVRERALETLKNERNRRDVLEAVVSLMENESSDDLARKAARFLGEADSSEYSVFETFFLLERGSKEERLKAAKKLASVEDDPRVVERLANALRENGGHEAVSSRAGQSLLKLQAYDALAEALNDGEVPAAVRMEIARGLAGESDPSATVDGLRYLGANAEGREGRQAVRSLGDVGTAEARKAVESFLTAEGRRLRLAAAETVQQIGSVKSLPVLADAVRSGRNAARMEQVGVEVLSSKKVQVVLEFTRRSDAVVQRIAYRALGPKAKAGVGGDAVLETLEKGAEASDPQIRGAAARGLGQLANDRALEILEGMTDDESPAVRRGVAHALGNYPSGKMTETLVSYLEDDSPEVVAAALSSLVDRNEKKEWARIKELVKSEHAVVREHAVIALASLVSKDDDEAARAVISLISGVLTSDQNESVLRTSLEQLGTFERKRAVNSIAIKLNAKSKQMQLSAIEALGETGHETAVDVLGDKIGNPDPEIRRAVVLALGKVGGSSARSTLQQRLQDEKDSELKKLIQETVNEL